MNTKGKRNNHAAPSVKYLSYDIFDTILSRLFFKPKDVFYFLELYLKKYDLIDEKFPFEKIRIKGEDVARLKSKKEEITFDEIYIELQEMTGWSDEKTIDIKNHELRFEEFCLCTIDATVKKLDSETIIISDIYFPKDFVRKILKKNKIPYQKLFLSSEYGLMKHFSSLFKIVLENLGIVGNQLYHVGDNEYSDVKMAKVLGIQTRHFSISNPSRYEDGVYALNYENRINSIVSGAMNVSRLNRSFISNHDQTIWNVATNIFGPFLFLYTYWVLERAKKENLSTLYFMSRDGHIMYQIAKKINKHLYNIEIKYLYGSRKAFHVPSITEIGNPELSWIFDETHHLSVNSVCARLEIKSCKIEAILKKKGFNDFEANLTLNERLELKDAVLSSVVIRKLIIQKAKERRLIVAGYLKQEGFRSDKNVGIVDIGWRGRQQRSLSKILQMEGLYPEEGIQGFYLSLPDKVKEFKNDKVHEYLPFSDYSELMLYHALYEVAVSADHGSCVGYEKKETVIEPVLRDVKNNQIYDWGHKIHQLGILTFTDNVMKTLSFVEIKQINNSQKISAFLLHKFLKYPLKNEAAAYSKIIIYEDQEEEKKINLVEKINTKELITSLYRPTVIFNENTWREGSFIYSLRKMGPTYQKIYRKAQSIKGLLVK